MPRTSTGRHIVGTIGLAAALAACSAGSTEPSGLTPAEPPFDPFETGTVTFGTRCGPEGVERYLVFSAAPGGCEAHAALVRGAAAQGDRAVLAAPTSAPSSFELMAPLCLDGACTDRTFHVELTEVGADRVAGRWSADVDGRSAAGPIAATVCDYDAFDPSYERPRVANLEVSEVALYQAVKIPLAEQGGEAARNAPVVAGRPGLLRVFVSPRANYVSERVTAELSWDRGDGAGPRVLESSQTVRFESTDADPGSTFNFALDGEDLTDRAEWSVTLRSERRCAVPDADTGGARLPTDGRLEVRAETVGTFNVVLVPIQYAFDGSNRLPDLSEAQLDRYRERIMAMYPVPEVNLSVRDAVTWERPISAFGEGWSDLLQGVLGLRARDDPDDNTFYYGIFRPEESMREFCRRGCVAGLGPLAQPDEELFRGAIGLGFAGEGSADTAAHELGHANGRRHAPCQVRDPDPEYPYARGGIGTWGYDILSGGFKDPSRYSDVMGYCDPSWISDYNYTALFERIRFVNSTQADVRGTPRPWRMVSLSGDAAATWGDRVELVAAPAGRPVAVGYFDAAGQLLGAGEGVEIGVDHLPEDRLVVVPAEPAGTVRLRIGGRDVVPDRAPRLTE